MRQINKIIIHCAATPGDVSADTINAWHVARGWQMIGYHYVIRTNGNAEVGRPVEQAGAHVKGHNSDSIGICLAGGKDGIANYTKQQLETLRLLVDGLVARHGAEVYGHKDFTDAKTCPNFNVAEWYSTV